MIAYLFIKNKRHGYSDHLWLRAQENPYEQESDSKHNKVSKQ